MARFSVYSGLILVGYSSLESGDPPMGVVFGQFEPNHWVSHYSKRVPHKALRPVRFDPFSKNRNRRSCSTYGNRHSGLR